MKVRDLELDVFHPGGTTIEDKGQVRRTRHG